MEEAMKRLANSIVEGDSGRAEAAAREVLAAGVAPLDAIDEGANKAMQVVGDQFSRYEIFLPELMLAGEAMKTAVEVLLEALPADQASAVRRGKVVLATVSGDIHEIGKNIVGALLTASGFQVYDLGVNVDVKQIMHKAREVKADIIALSALLTVSLPYQEDVVNYLRDAGLRDKCFVIIGGGPVTPEWARQIGADGYGRAAVHAVELCKRLVTGSRPPLAEPLVFDFGATKETGS